MFFLGIDTTGTIGSLCLLASDNVKCIVKPLQNTKISENLLVELQNFLKTEQISLSEIKGIGVNIGPGSFTGLRVGVSFAKGLAKAIGCDCFYISLEECLREIIEEKLFEKSSLLVNLGKKGVIIYDIYDGKLSNDSELISLENFKSEIEKEVYLYNLSEFKLEIENLSVNTVASDNVTTKLTKITRRKFENKIKTSYDIIYI
jgi:tRNA threonylcarbamoyl adenosine modification protein YeaZ